MNLEDLLIRLMNVKDNEIDEDMSYKSFAIIEVNNVEEAPTKDKKQKNSNV